MRRSLPRLAYMLTQLEKNAPGDYASMQFGQIAKIFNEEVPRIMDALDLLKVMRGEYQEIPDIPWEYPYNL